MEVVWLPGGVRTEIHLDGARTGGALCLLVDDLPPGWSLPAHRHANESETMHVLEGCLDVVLDGEHRRVDAGGTVHVPRGVSHETSNGGDGRLRRVIVFAPAGLEDFFREAGAATPDEQADLASVLKLAGRFGWRFA